MVNWDRIPEFKDFIFKSNIGLHAAKLLNSKKSIFFHDDVLVKEPGSSIVKPWHQDKPYYCVDGKKSVSFWIALDDISKEGCLECIAGSHLSNTLHKPKRFNGKDLYENDNSLEVPDIRSVCCSVCCNVLQSRVQQKTPPPNLLSPKGWP